MRGLTPAGNGVGVIEVTATQRIRWSNKLVPLFFLGLSGCIHGLSAGARGAISTEGTTAVGVPLSMGLPIAIHDESEPIDPSHVIAVGFEVVPQFLLPATSDDASFTFLATPYVQYLYSIDSHSVGARVRGGVAYTRRPTGTIGADLLYQAPLGQSTREGYDATYLSRHRLGLTVGIEWAPVPRDWDNYAHEMFFTVGASWIYESLLTDLDSESAAD